MDSLGVFSAVGAGVGESFVTCLPPLVDIELRNFCCVTRAILAKLRNSSCVTSAELRNSATGIRFYRSPYQLVTQCLHNFSHAPTVAIQAAGLARSGFLSATSRVDLGLLISRRLERPRSGAAACQSCRFVVEPNAEVTSLDS